MNQQIIALLTAALECSYFLNPLDPGLSSDELLEIGRRGGFLPGEIKDAMRYVTASHPGSEYWHLVPNEMQRWNLIIPEEPELRNMQAFDFVISQLNFQVRSEGQSGAQISRQVVVERAISEGIRQVDIEAAVTVQALSGKLQIKDGVIRFAHQGGVQALPSEQAISRNPIPKPARAQALPIVQDLIARRTNSRTLKSEPLEAFPDALQSLGYGNFRLWWMQTVSEMQRSEASSHPLALTVLSASLVEGALTFVVRHARDLNLDVFRSSDYDRDPRSWKIDDLIKSAATGGKDAVLDQQTKVRAETLAKTRQRIHAGRMLSDFPAGVPDLRPDEARDAKATAERVVRNVLDWLESRPKLNAF